MLPCSVWADAGLPGSGPVALVGRRQQRLSGRCCWYAPGVGGHCEPRLPRSARRAAGFPSGRNRAACTHGTHAPHMWDMGADEVPRLGGKQTFTCPFCGLPQDRVPTLERDWVLLEPGVDVLAHLVPAEYRWIGLSDGRVTVYAVCPPDSSQRCRIEHRLACSEQQLPDLWPWLTALRGENARRAAREASAESPVPADVELPDVG